VKLAEIAHPVSFHERFEQHAPKRIWFGWLCSKFIGSNYFPVGQVKKNPRRSEGFALSESLVEG
jgi:hypothetical protein